MKDKKNTIGLEQLRDDIRDGFKNLVSDINTLQEYCEAAKEAGDIISVDVLLHKILSRIEKRLVACQDKATRMRVDPFSILEWPDSTVCEGAEYDDDGVMIPDSECKEQATMVGCVDGDGLKVTLFCVKHFNKAWDWRWHAPLPLMENLLKEDD